MFAFDFVSGLSLSGRQVLQRRRVARFRHSRLGSRLRRSPFGNSDPVTLGCDHGNFAKKNASFYEGYAKVNVNLNDMFAIGANEYYSPNFLNLGAWGNYASVTGKFTAPGTWFGHHRHRHVCVRRSSAGSGLVLRRLLRHPGVPGRHSRAQLQHLERRRRLHLQGLHSRLPLFRHTCPRVSANAFTSDYTATTATAASVSAINPGGFESGWCGATASSSSRLT